MHDFRMSLQKVGASAFTSRFFFFFFKFTLYQLKFRLKGKLYFHALGLNYSGGEMNFHSRTRTDERKFIKLLPELKAVSVEVLKKKRKK